MRKATKAIGILGLLVGVLVAPVQAGIAVKFFGEATAGDLTPAAAQAVERSGIDVTGFACFQAPLLDLETGLEVGTGVDCLNVFDTEGDEAGAGLQIEAKTFFIFPHGMIVNHGCTSVRPFFSGVGDAAVTHVTGSIGPRELGGEVSPGGPAVCQATGGIVHATRGFRNFTGAVRLSGAVDLSQAAMGTITFSCVFVIDLDRKPGDREEAAEDDPADNRWSRKGAIRRQR